MASQCAVCSSQIDAGSTFCSACGARQATPDCLDAGRRLHGTYEILRVLGQGGFGITYLATDLTLGRQVAIKEFYPLGSRRTGDSVQPGTTIGGALYEQCRARFLDEGRALARFDHPAIVRVLFAFEENETAYIVMDFVGGRTLGQVLGEGRPDEARVRRWLQTICDALSLIHQNDLLHRDLKPSNIILNAQDQPVLIDFGTARQFAEGATSRQSVMLTPGYAPIEQYAERGRRGPWTDIYSLSATFYHVLAGHAPPSAPDRIAGEAIADLGTVRPDLSPALCDAIMRGLQMDAGRRPQTAADFIGLMDGMHPSASPSAAASPSPPTAAAGPAWSPAPQWQAPTRESSAQPPTIAASDVAAGPQPAAAPSSARPWLVMLLSIALLVGIVILARSSRGDSSGSSSTPPTTSSRPPVSMQPILTTVSTTPSPQSATVSPPRRQLPSTGTVEVKLSPLAPILIMQHCWDMAALSEDGQRLVVFSPDSVFFADAPKLTMRAMETQRIRDSAGMFLGLSADGRTAVTKGEGLHVWDATTGKELRKADVEASAWSPDGTLFAAVRGQNCDGVYFTRCSDLSHAFDIQVESPGRYALCYSSMAFSPDGARLAAGSEQLVNIYDVAGRRLSATLTPGLDGLQWSPDGSRLAGITRDSAVVVFDVASGKVVFQKKVPPHVPRVLWLPQGRVLLCGFRGDGEDPLVAYDTETAREVARLSGGPPLAVSGNGLLVVAPRHNLERAMLCRFSVK